MCVCVSRNETRRIRICKACRGHISLRGFHVPEMIDDCVAALCCVDPWIDPPGETESRTASSARAREWLIFLQLLAMILPPFASPPRQSRRGDL